MKSDTMHKRLWIPLGLGILLAAPAACIYKSKVPRFKLPKGYRQKKQPARQTRRVGRFWRAFRDRQLERLIAQAFARSPDLTIARERIAQAKAQLMGATAGYYPTIGFNAQAGRSQTVLNLGSGLSNIPNFDSTPTTNTFRLSLSAAYEIDIWGKVRYARKSAKQQLVATREDLRAAYLSLAANLADAYYVLVQQRELLALLDRTIENRQRQLALVRRRYVSGVSRASDYYQALQLLAQARAQREQTVGLLKTASHAVTLLAGRYPGEVPLGKLARLPRAVRELRGGLPGDLLLQRPDLRAALARLKAVDAQVGVALAAHFPSINLNPSLGFQFDPNGFFWSLVAQLTAPLFQGGRIRAEYQRSKAVLRENIAAFKKVLLVAVKEVEDALARGRAVSAQIAWIEKSVAAAEGALRLATDQYAQGLTIYLNVLSSEQALFTARSSLISARRELVSARIALARALGGGWMDDEIAAQRSKQTGSR